MNKFHVELIDMSPNEFIELCNPNNLDVSTVKDYQGLKSVLETLLNCR